MTEQQLQFHVVNWFRNKVPSERGTLFAIQNETNKGAFKKGLGMLPGASDLGYVAIDGMFVGFELKVSGSRHDIAHLKRQLAFAEKVTRRGGLGFFIFTKTHFQAAMANIAECGANIRAAQMAENSRKFIARCIELGETRGNKTVALKWSEEDM